MQNKSQNTNGNFIGLSIGRFGLSQKSANRFVYKEHHCCFLYLLFQVFVIPHKNLLYLSNVHGVIVTLGIIGVDDILIEETVFLQF